MSKKINLTNEQLMDNLKNLQDRETGEFNLNDVIHYLKQIKNTSVERKRIYEYFKTIRDNFNKGKSDFELTLPNGDGLKIVGIHDDDI